MKKLLFFITIYLTIGCISMLFNVSILMSIFLFVCALLAPITIKGFMRGFSSSYNSGENTTVPAQPGSAQSVSTGYDSSDKTTMSSLDNSGDAFSPLSGVDTL